jgi:hypothetical protein
LQDVGDAPDNPAELGVEWTRIRPRHEPASPPRLRLGAFELGNPGSNKGHVSVNVQYSCVVVGCHLRRKVFEFAVSHEPHKPKIGSLSLITARDSNWDSNWSTTDNFEQE